MENQSDAAYFQTVDRNIANDGKIPFPAYTISHCCGMRNSGVPSFGV
ncbi:MAG TPA: hypothetical protein H9733_08000 [Candidatus Anaerotignum merdipullorum]|nr:hypothetical protein [Candidatus Anaerotignum merdipullorum]